MKNIVQIERREKQINNERKKHFYSYKLLSSLKKTNKINMYEIFNVYSLNCETKVQMKENLLTAQKYLRNKQIIWHALKICFGTL